MKKSIEEHLKNIRENVPGLSDQDIRSNIIGNIVNSEKAKAARAGTQMPTLVISEDHIVSAIEANSALAKKIITAVFDFENKQSGKKSAKKKKARKGKKNAV
jgi:hypothetical protein